MGDENSQFREWLLGEYLDWQKTEKGVKSIGEFAERCNISRSLMSQFLSGKKMPARKTIDLLANELGYEVYDILKLEKPEPGLQMVVSKWNSLPSQAKAHIIEFIQKY